MNIIETQEQLRQWAQGRASLPVQLPIVDHAGSCLDFIVTELPIEDVEAILSKALPQSPYDLQLWATPATPQPGTAYAQYQEVLEIRDKSDLDCRPQSQDEQDPDQQDPDQQD